MYSVQLAVKTQLIHCTVCTMYKNYTFRPILAISRLYEKPGDGQNRPKHVVLYIVHTVQ